MILKALLCLTTVLFALILGGNLYEQLVIVVGRWADDPPAMLIFWREILESGHFNFYALTPAAILTSVLSIPFAWRQPAVRRDFIVAAVSIILVLVITLVWAVPMLGGLFPEQVWERAAAAKLPPKSPAELAQIISQFKILSWIRWLVLLSGFLALLHALRAAKSPALASPPS